MEIFGNIALGFGVALTMSNLLYCLLGVTLGTAIGVLPGVGPLVTISMLLPITFNLDATAALIMLAGIYYGASYGGSTTAILINLPGESNAVVTCLDGHAMAKQGRAGPALAIAALGSFVAGTIATVIIALFAPPIAQWALSFNSPEYFTLMLLGLLTASGMAQGSILKAIAMVILGLLFGLIGTDINSGAHRFDFGILQLLDGISFVIVAMGLFGIAEIVTNLEDREHKEVFTAKITSLMPTRKDLADSWRPILRGTAVGSFFGILPGAGTTISSFMAYIVERRVARDPSRFGKGAIEGVAGPESANNAAAQTAFIPTLTLGIPGSGTMALMLGALIIHGIQPGPGVMTEHPELFWGLIASMWIGNLFLVVLNLPLIGIWVRMVQIPYRLLYPSIVVLCCVGVYTLSSSYVDVILMALSGLLGYVFVKLECEPAPLLLGYILGPMMEENLRRSMLLSRGDPTIFVTQPISLCILLFMAGMLVLLLIPSIRQKRKEAVMEGEQ